MQAEADSLLRHVFGFLCVVTPCACSFYLESAVEAEEKPSPPIKDDTKSKRREFVRTMNPLELIFYSSKWDDWLASSFGIEGDDDECAHEEVAVSESMHSG